MRSKEVPTQRPSHSHSHHQEGWQGCAAADLPKETGTLPLPLLIMLFCACDMCVPAFVRLFVFMFLLFFYIVLFVWFVFVFGFFVFVFVLFFLLCFALLVFTNFTTMEISNMQHCLG
jgi:hypothetical protein